MNLWPQGSNKCKKSLIFVVFFVLVNKCQLKCYVEDACDEVKQFGILVLVELIAL